MAAPLTCPGRPARLPPPAPRAPAPTRHRLLAALRSQVRARGALHRVASDLTARVIEHQTGRGARLIEAVIRSGGSFALARTWPDTDRTFERRLHRRKESPRLCPLCSKQLPLPFEESP